VTPEIGMESGDACNARLGEPAEEVCIEFSSFNFGLLMPNKSTNEVMR
jgi:hypothetical protein